MENIEIWKDVVGYEGLYQVSNLGRVKSLLKEERILSRKTCKNYKMIHLFNGKMRKQFLIHRLVAEAFIPNPNNYPCVNHKDENKINNCADNLEWCTHKYNMNYGTKPSKVGSFFSKPVIQKSINAETIKEYPSARQAERETGVSNAGINLCINKKRKTAGGYIWEKGE